VTRRTLLTPEMSNNFNLGVGNFSAGARNKMHIHTSDQALLVTARLNPARLLPNASRAFFVIGRRHLRHPRDSSAGQAFTSTQLFDQVRSFTRRGRRRQWNNPPCSAPPHS